MTLTGGIRSPRISFRQILHTKNRQKGKKTEQQPKQIHFYTFVSTMINSTTGKRFNSMV